MKHKSIQYWETFLLPNGGFVKLIDEILLEEGDNPRDAFYEGKKTVRAFFHESLNHDKKVASESVVLDEDGKTIADILLCTDLPTLKTFELVSKKSKSIKTVYNQKLNELTIKKTKQLP